MVARIEATLNASLYGWSSRKKHMRASTGAFSAGSSPSILIVPPERKVWLKTTYSRVVFPAPLGPRSP